MVRRLHGRGQFAKLEAHLDAGTGSRMPVQQWRVEQLRRAMRARRKHGRMDAASVATGVVVGGG